MYRFWGGSAVVVDDFDVVAVGVQDERAVVARVADRELAGTAVVLVARGERGGRIYTVAALTVALVSYVSTLSPSSRIVARLLAAASRLSASGTGS